MQFRFQLLLVVSLVLPVSINAVDEEIERTITQNITTLLADDFEITSISESPIKNIYEVIIGTEVIYSTADGKYFIQGELFDVANRISITEVKRNEVRQATIADLNEKTLIPFNAAKEKNAIYVFTDIDCGYCRKLHNDIPELNRAGISIKYLAFPRSGAGSLTWNEMAEVWCAADKAQAITDAKFGKRGDLGKGNTIEQLQVCNQIIEDQYRLGKEMGVRGTPAIYLENGYPVKGYLPPDTLIDLISNEG